MPAQPDTLYLHLGHNKTASTFLQTVLAYSIPTLAEHGIFYPLAAKKLEAARKGEVVGPNLGAAPHALKALLKLPMPTQTNRMLISGEGLFFELSRTGDTLLRNLRAAFPNARMKVLLYVRDPVDHVVSFYHQQVKHGYTGTLGDRMRNYNMPRRVAQGLALLRDAGAEVTVLNYSRHSKAVLGTMETWLDLPLGVLTAPEQTQVNRSLTNAELELQRVFNRHFGDKAYRMVSMPLIDGLPDLRSETPPLSREDLAVFLDRMQEQVDTEDFRALVPEAERPWVGTVDDHIARFPSPEEGAVLTFSSAQISLFAEAMAKRLIKKGVSRDKPGKPEKPGENLTEPD